MPELPEVEVVRRGLEPRLVGRIIVDAACLGPRLRLAPPLAEIERLAVGGKGRELRRRGKYLLLELDNQTRLVFHLGMTGRLGIFPKNEQIKTHDHWLFALDDQTELRFNDTRRFGSLQLLPPGQDEAAIFGALGPEPLQGGFSAAYLLSRAQGRRQPVKSFLMDNRVVVGIGNIYASEILFAAAISPWRPAREVTAPEWEVLVATAREVLVRAIAAGGSTIADFVNASGRPGYFQRQLKAYGREGQPCPRCGGLIVRQAMAGRAAFFCPGCQR